MEPTAIYAERQGNLTGETVAMSVDAASMAHVMSILTDLYSDPTLAVIREYSTNAFDSHVEAGVKRPIEVSLPNVMSPFFKVRDYGVGLSVEDIRNVYSKYGASTKRSTNEQVGMLGLGCKSALTYTQQFTVRSVKDGKLALVAISRTETGSGVMEIVHTADYDEENGVEISIPVNRDNDFDWKARDFFRFWEPGTVLVDGAEPQRIEGTDLGNGIQLIKSAGTDYVVMGNVGYRVSKEHSLYNDRNSHRGRSFGLVVKVPIGSVNFTPSREDLHYTETTITTLDKAREQIQMSLMDTIQADIESKPDRATARDAWLEWRNVTGSKLSDMTYKGDTIPGEIRVEHLRYRPDSGRYCVTNYSYINFHEIRRYVFVSGYEKDEISTSHRAKLRLWASQNGYANMSFIVTKEPIEQKWFTCDRTATWEEVFAAKKPRQVNDSGNENFSVHDGTSRYPTLMSNLPDDKAIIIWTTSDPGYEENISKIVSCHGNAVAVRLAKNRWDKFLRDHKNAVKVWDVIPTMVQNAFNALSEDEKLSMTIGYDDSSHLYKLDPKRLDDPELARYTRVVQGVKKTDAILHYNEVANLATRLGFQTPKIDKAESPSVKYPLLDALSTYDALTIEHFYIYANIIYSKESN